MRIIRFFAKDTASKTAIMHLSTRSLPYHKIKWLSVKGMLIAITSELEYLSQITS